MLRMVSDWERSGRSKKQYCRENGIAYSKFRYWSARSREGLTGPVGSVALERPPVKEGIEVIYPNGVRLGLRAGGDLGLLSRLIHLY